MNLFKKVFAGGGALAVSFALVLASPLAALAVASTPSLGIADTYGILASTYTNTVIGTTINGDVGYTTGPATVPTINGTTHIADGSYNQAGIDQGSALSLLNAQSCDFSFGSATDLSLLSQPLAPGVYCITGAASIGTGGITLNGNGTYVFRITGALTTVANSVVSVTGGASACNVFWTPSQATTLGANSTFIGTDIDAAGISIGSTILWTGRALAFGGTVSTNADTITVPTCTTPTPPPPPPSSGSTGEGKINVVKIVINDNGGTKTVNDFPLFLNGRRIISGMTTGFAAGLYTVTETSDSHYTQTFSGDCDATGHIDLTPYHNLFCILTNNDIGAPVVPPVPPLIDVVKIPSPLALPNGPGSVTYTYTLHNVGTVPVTDITMVDDTCSSLTFVSGDTNGDNKLDVNEIWTYRCTTTLSATTMNTVVATGWANGLSTSDIANATVVVGVPIVPPLIHVTKIPSPLTLAAGGGMVTYTEKVTNPGTVPLNNVRLTDDKCAPNYQSGDSNADSKLDPTETWVYTCRTNLTKTTVNTAVATGDANGFSVRDFAIATVVVAGLVPKLPNTGVAPQPVSFAWDLVVLAGVLVILGFLLMQKKHKKHKA